MDVGLLLRDWPLGRGGPGLTSNVDTQKQVGGPAIFGDSTLHQPIGLPLAATAASVMAGALGDVQTGGMSSKQTGLQNQSGVINDPLTHYLAKMSKHQLQEVMSEMKAMATQKKELARQLLVASPQLSKALFQAQIMLGMVTPQMLQMTNIRQSTVSQPPVQDGLHSQQQAALPSHPPVPQGALYTNQTSAIPQQQVPMQHRFQHPQQAQSQVPLQTTIVGQSGISTVPSIQPQPFTGLPPRPQTQAVATSTALKQQMQQALLQHPRQVGTANLGHTSQLVLPNAALQHPSLLPRPPLAQQSFQPVSSVLSGGPETIHKDAERATQATDDATWIPRSIAGDGSDPTIHPSKLARLEDGRSASHSMISKNTSVTTGLTQVVGTGPLSANQVASEGVQHSENQVPQLQLPPEVESALLQQVMSLTAEQLSSLPPEQRQQVIQLQQMLR
ncbi:PREDICTED: cleavage stimulating factor 64 isoform X2 [Nelumbo nucifera]|uniref:Cleavage stimulating factor 64 isoform X2 n=1 Tax=Nelumbo nucifera TaxID=4432 RepID=A0A1U7YVK4_NELNU|nr:PREDICTED: cleavage stimulating factor 64 isoform X2 [Nelumbo nucifera]